MAEFFKKSTAAERDWRAAAWRMSGGKNSSHSQRAEKGTAPNRSAARVARLPKAVESRAPGLTRPRKVALLSTLLMSVLLVLVPDSGKAQAFGQFTPASISSEGEGGLFLLAGNDAFRTGAMTRFSINGRSDFGIHLGIEKCSEQTSKGLGGDLKILFYRRTDAFPIDVAGDASIIHLRSDEIRSLVIGGHLLMSSRFEGVLLVPFEPYLSVNLLFTDFSPREAKVYLPMSCCNPGEDQGKTRFDTGIRLGARFFLGRDIQAIMETDISRRTFIGGGINFIF